MRIRLLAVAGIVMLASVTPTVAQDLPATVEAEDRAVAPPPEEPSTIDKLRTYVEKRGLIERMTGGDGFYPRFGGLTTGSGLAGGAGYRTHLPGNVFADVSAVISTKNYKGFDAKARWATFWNERLELWTTFKARDYPQEDFYGFGPDSQRNQRTNYAFRATDIGGRVAVNVFPWLKTGVDLGRLSPVIGPGHDAVLPSTELLFADRDAPGLDEQPAFFYTTIFAEADYRDQPGNPHRGGYVRASWGSWDDRNLQRYDYRRFDAEAAHFVPLAPRHVVALHMGLAYANNETGDRVPFYMLPYVGGSDTLRAFDEFRFRDENNFYLNGEYRFDLLSFLELAAFVDAGEVRPDWEDIGFTDLRRSYGGGIRVKTKKQVFLRFDAGTGGGEGGQIFLKFGKSF